MVAVVVADGCGGDEGSVFADADAGAGADFEVVSVGSSVVAVEESEIYGALR